MHEKSFYKRIPRAIQFYIAHFCNAIFGPNIPDRVKSRCRFSSKKPGCVIFYLFDIDDVDDISMLTRDT